MYNISVVLYTILLFTLSVRVWFKELSTFMKEKPSFYNHSSFHSHINWHDIYWFRLQTNLHTISVTNSDVKRAITELARGPGSFNRVKRTCLDFYESVRNKIYAQTTTCFKSVRNKLGLIKLWWKRTLIGLE